MHNRDPHYTYIDDLTGETDKLLRASARELRDACRLWPQNLTAEQLEAELAECDRWANPISWSMLTNEQTRRAGMREIEYDTLAEALGAIVDSPGWLPIARTLIGRARPAGPSRSPSPRCTSGKRPYCTCDTCF